MDTYKKYYGQKKLKLKKSVSKYISKILLSIILLLLSVIFINSSDLNKSNYEKYLFKDMIPYSKINTWYEKYFGSVVPINVVDSTDSVFNERLEYKTIDKYLDGYILSVDNNYMIPTIESGVIVYIGEKENYGNTIIVQGVDGVDIWYSNITSTDYNLYDYVTKSSPLCLVNNSFYLVFMKDNNYITYEEYNKI